MIKTQDKPIAWMVSRSGLPVSLVWWTGKWCVMRPTQMLKPNISYSPEGSERLQPLDEFLAEAQRALDLTPITMVVA